jgi:transcriptional regulator with XRE-family HTH domain
VSDHPLRRGLGHLLRARRQAAGLSQDVLARDSGLNQAQISRVERGVVSATVDTIERLFAALGLQLRFTAESLDAQLDAELARLSAIPLALRLEDSDWPYLVRQLGDLPYVIEGALAALVQDVPLMVDAADLVITVEDIDAFDAWLRRQGAVRWHERWQEFRMLNPNPRVDGAMRWKVGFTELRARFTTHLPECLEVRHDDTAYRVRPLAALELGDPMAAGLLRRYLERSRP